MNIETVSIESISADPANVRAHPEKNLRALAASLKRFGQQKPLVVDGNGIVRAGNGTLAAARSIGLKEIKIVRTDLVGAEATAYAVADNRTGDLSEFSTDVSALVESLKMELPDLAKDLALDDLVKKVDLDATAEQVIESRFDVLVQCADEHAQAALLEKLMSEGHTCKALIS